MSTSHTVQEIGRIAREAGIDPAALLAVAEVETGLRAHTEIGGRREPLIRFEGHYFDRLLTGERQALARRLGLASPRAGAVANPASQAERWRMLERAAGIDRKAALESASWGLGQVMGAHWAWLGYAGVEALVAEVRSGAAGQARLMALYIVKAGLAEALRARDWAAFARGYNGPGYRASRYDEKIAAAFARHERAGPHPDAGSAAVGGVTSRELLRRGDKGASVEGLQTVLAALGYPLAPDGMFGPLTESAVRRFQKAHGLDEDGVVGPLTRAALSRALPRLDPFRFVWNRLARWWRGLRH